MERNHATGTPDAPNATGVPSARVPPPDHQNAVEEVKEPVRLLP